jgi:hypothetical protein
MTQISSTRLETKFRKKLMEKKKIKHIGCINYMEILRTKALAQLEVDLELRK